MGELIYHFLKSSSKCVFADYNNTLGENRVNMMPAVYMVYPPTTIQFPPENCFSCTITICTLMNTVDALTEQQKHGGQTECPFACKNRARQIDGVYMYAYTTEHLASTGHYTKQARTYKSHAALPLFSLSGLIWPHKI